MEIIEMKTEDLIPYEHNPRKNDEAVEMVEESIKSFGFRVPIIVDKDNVIIAGHTRLKAAQRLGIETVPVIRADDLSADEVKAYRLVDNKVAEFSAWDKERLQAILEQYEEELISKFGLNLEPYINFDQFFGEADEKLNLIKCPLCGQYFDRKVAEERNAVE